MVSSRSRQQPAASAGATPECGPVWLQIPIVYHRDIPADAMIKSVSATRRFGGWSLNVTVSVPEPELRKAGHGIAIDLGWRLMPDRVRVAYWVDTAGAQGQVVVSASDMSQFERVRSLRSTCDRMRDEFLPALVEWLAGLELPEAWQQQIVALAQWRSSDRLVRLVRWWADNRLPGDDELRQQAREWRRQYLHVANWRRDLEDQLCGRMREQYRIFAAGLARDYCALYLEDFDLRKVAERPKPESKEVRTASARYRQMVSPSVLRHAVTSACAREGVRIVEVAAEYTTRICYWCRHTGEWEPAASVMHTCGGCGRTWDQDENAARNLLALGQASGAVAATGNQPVGERKWDRVRDRSRKPAETQRTAAIAN